MTAAVQALREVFQRCAERPCLLVADGTSLSYAETRGRALAAAERFVNAGLRPGDVLGVLAANGVDHAVALLGAWTAGLCVAPLNGALGPDQVHACVGNARPAAILHDVEHAALAASLGPPLPLAKPTSEAASAAEGKLFAALDPEAPFLIIYTAGSTGAPKGVQISANALLENEAAFCDAVGVTEANRFFNILPMSYLGGVHNLLLLPLMRGASVVIDKPLGPSNLFYFWRRVRERGIDTLWLTGAMLSLLLEIPPRGDESWIGGQVRLGLVGMAPLHPDLRARFETRFGFRLHQNYALSETLFLTTQRPEAETLSPAGCGQRLDPVAIRLLGADGEDVHEGGEGEIVVHTPHMMLGYRDAAPSDAAALQNGAFRTGDLGRFDAAGELVVTGRLKDLIIRGGLNIAPAVVERALLRSPLVADAAVVGVPDAVYGEAVAASVVLNAAGLALPADKARAAVLRDAAAGLAPTQSPSSLTLMETLPRNHAGKIDKPALRRLLAGATS